jgi:Peptidase propeptide and YPEB domain
MRAFPVLAPIFGAVVVIAGSAAAEETDVVCVGGPKDQWVDAQAIKDKMSKMLVGEFVMDFEHGCYEVEYSANEDTVIAFYVDPVTTEIIRVKVEDE